MRFLRLGLVATISLFLAACTPAPTLEPVTPPAQPVKERVAPTDLRVDLGDLTASLSWTTNLPENRVISGYHIYVGTAEADFSRLSDEPYPGDTSPDYAVESYLMENLIAGAAYRVYVTTVYPGGGESQPTNTVELIARPEGKFQIRESFSSAESGFSFNRRLSVPTDDLSNDIYLAVISGSLYLASPLRIDGVLRQTEFHRLNTKQPLSKLRVIEKPSRAEDKCPVVEAEVILIRTADNNHALLRIEAIDRVDRIVTVNYIYQTRPGELRFQ